MNRAACTLLLIAGLIALSAVAPRAAAEVAGPAKSVPELVYDVRPSVVLIRTGGTRIDYKRLPEGKQQAANIGLTSG